MTTRTELVILRELWRDATFAEKVLPHIESDYFADRAERHVYDAIKKHRDEYSACPSKEALKVDLSQTKGLDQDDHEDCLRIVSDFDSTQCVNGTWLMNQAETFVRERRRLQFTLGMIEGNDVRRNPPTPEEYAKAMSFSFDQSVGHDLFVDSEALFDYMTNVDEKFPFDVDSLNHLTNGGVSRKTMNVLLAATNAGKSLFMCHLSASYLRQGRNVLYVTLEMSDKTTAQRITANLMDIEIGHLRKMSSQQFDCKMEELREKSKGNLIVHEYPASSASVNTIRALLRELRQKKQFVPDVVVVDYLNLCSSAAFRKANGVGSFQYVGAIANELRGLATEQNIVLWTATQANRSGYKGVSLELEHTSESYGINSAADLIFALSRDEKVPDTMSVKLLKQRNEGVSGSLECMLAVNSAKMKVFEIDPAAQVKVAMKAMSSRSSSNSAATKVEARTPKCARGSEASIEAVA